MAKCHRVKVFAFAKFQAVFSALLGVVVGTLYAFAGLVIDLLVSAELLSATLFATHGLSFGTFLAFGALVGMPIIFALLGYIFGLLEALLYNWYARWFGAIDIDFWRGSL
jgi:prepilin signal peptidase PulO-like enzyme (type II secretory pathway)